MRAEYDFKGGVRGKHYRAMQAGYTITIHEADGTTIVKEVMQSIESIGVTHLKGACQAKKLWVRQEMGLALPINISSLTLYYPF